MTIYTYYLTIKVYNHKGHNKMLQPKTLETKDHYRFQMDPIKGGMGLLMVILLKAQSSAGLYGYDCGDQISNLTTISLTDIGSCNLERPRVNITKINGQLLQLNDYDVTRVFICRIKITRTVTHCGMNSHSSRVGGGELSYFKDTGRDECETLHKSGYFTVGNTQVYGIKPNSTVHKSITFAGTIDSDGRCYGAGYSDTYGSWEKVVVAGWIEITIRDYYAEVHLDTNEVKLVSGAACKLSEGKCVDFDAGHVFWSVIPEDTCGIKKFSILFEGKIDKIQEEKSNQIMYALESEQITFGLWKKGEQGLCGFKISRTEHPKLFILEDARENTITKKVPPATANLNMFAYMNSKFLYIEKHIRGQLTEMYYSILQNKCELERKVLINALAIATTSPAEAGYRIMEERGYLGVVTGEVMHLLKCIRVEVKQRPTKECYEQLPVFWDDKPLFLAPRTRILLRTGTQILCDRRMPPMFKINKLWIKLLPDAVSAEEPEILKPQTKPAWKYHSADSLAISGIYSQQDLNRIRDMLLFPMERAGVLNNVALGMTGHPINNQQVSLHAFLNAETLEALADSTWKNFWAKFLSFGTASAGMIGILMICRLIKLLIDTVVHGFALYSIYGFSIHLIGALWNSITQLLLHLGQKAKQEEEEQIKSGGLIENEESNKSEKKVIASAPLYPHLDLNHHIRKDSI